MSLRAINFMHFKNGLYESSIGLMEPMQRLELILAQVAQLPDKANDTGVILHQLQQHSLSVLASLKANPGRFPRPPEALHVFAKAMTQSSLAREIAREIVSLDPKEAMSKGRALTAS